MSQSLDAIRLLFTDNLARVDGLVTNYSHLKAAAGNTTGTAGRASVQTADVLRSAVVFLHAAFEDLLRSLELAFLPHVQSTEALKTIGFPHSRGRLEKITLSHLAEHYRELSVQEVIDACVEDHLESKSYGDTTRVINAMRSIGANPDLIEESLPDLAAMMSRRHHIVHQADRDTRTGTGYHGVRSLSLAEVSNWRATVENVGEAVLSNLPERG